MKEIKEIVSMNKTFRSLVKSYSPEINEDGKKVTFEDVIGIDEYLSEIMEVLDFLQNKELYLNNNIQIPKGVLMYGPPGTGKTLIAKALANEANVNFFYVSSADIKSKYLGGSSNNIKTLFKNARKKSPSIIFIDEIDSIGRKRTHTSNADTINQILTEMDGFEKDNNVLVIGCTNVISHLDEALLRPGRFDRLLKIPLPKKESRVKLFEYFIKSIKHKQMDSLDYLADKTKGFSGADIKNLVNLAALSAVSNQRDAANKQDFEIAFDKVRRVSKNLVNKSDKSNQFWQILAANKAAKAFLDYKLGIKSVQKIELLALKDHFKLEQVGDLGSVKMQTLNKRNKPMEYIDKQFTTKDQIIKSLRLLLAPKVIEQILFDTQVSIEASLDYKKASDLILENSCLLELGNVLNNNKDSFNPNYYQTSEFYKKVIEQKAEVFLQELLEENKQLFKENISTINNISNFLIKNENITKKELKNLIK